MGKIVTIPHLTEDTCNTMEKEYNAMKKAVLSMLNDSKKNYIT